MQLLILPELSDRENFWLQSMRTDLRAGGEIRKLMREYEKHRKSKDYAAVMDLITRANWEQMEVEKKMCDALKELFAEELKEADSKGRTEGIQQGFTQGVQLTKQVLKLAAQGESPEVISEKCSISLEQVKESIRTGRFMVQIPERNVCIPAVLHASPYDQNLLLEGGALNHLSQTTN